MVIRNANLGGWGDEERDYEAEFPFAPNQYFDAMFVATDDKYHVSIFVSCKISALDFQINSQNKFCSFSFNLDICNLSSSNCSFCTRFIAVVLEQIFEENVQYTFSLLRV